MARKFNWGKYESQLAKSLTAAVLEVMQQYPDEHFYGAANWPKTTFRRFENWQEMIRTDTLCEN